MLQKEKPDNLHLDYFLITRLFLYYWKLWIWSQILTEKFPHSHTHTFSLLLNLCLSNTNIRDRETQRQRRVYPEILIISVSFHRLPWWLRGLSLCPQCRSPRFDPSVRKIPWRRQWHPTPVLLFGESHGGRSLVGYSPQGRKKSDRIERLHFHFSLLHREGSYE